MSFLYLKALHIIFVTTWFAGLFYIVRIFIYHVEATEKPEPERSILITEYQRNAKRLWFGITWPSAVITLLFGLSLVHQYGVNIPVWLWVKIGFVFGLYLYHLSCHRIYAQLQRGVVRYTSQQLRVWNEVATVFLVAIIFLVILRSTMSMVWGLVGLIIFTIVLMAAIKIYKSIRMKSMEQQQDGH